jgi:DNA-binding PadR family transcriptional regulator
MISLKTFYILAALAGDRLHGYAIIEKVKRLSDGEVQISVGTLYGTLDRLLSEGSLREDGEEIANGRLRRYYALTAEGAARLSEEANRYARASQAARIASAKST